MWITKVLNDTMQWPTWATNIIEHIRRTILIDNWTHESKSTRRWDWTKEFKSRIQVVGPARDVQTMEEWVRKGKNGRWRGCLCSRNGWRTRRVFLYVAFRSRYVYVSSVIRAFFSTTGLIPSRRGFFPHATPPSSAVEGPPRGDSDRRARLQLTTVELLHEDVYHRLSFLSLLYFCFR